MDLIDDIVIQIELHSVEGIRQCFASGLDPNTSFRGEPLIFELTSEYTRTPRFKKCVKAFVEHGLEFSDQALLAVLLDDPGSLERQIKTDPGLASKKYNLRAAFTPLYQATLLHICAEFNHVACAEVLVKHGADVNAIAGSDEFGFGGQTPIFHTVNQNANYAEEMMQFLLQHKANLLHTVRGLVWGKGYEWETLIPAVSPISYAMMGLLPQMHREESTISKVVASLLNHQYGIDYSPRNIPNAYLNK